MNSQKTNNIITRVSALMPYFYLTFISLFFIWVRISDGQFPSYGNPDPKNFPILYFIEVILMLLIPISFIFLLVMVVRSISSRNWRQIRIEFLIGTIGFLLIVLLVKFDPMGILNWLAD